MPERSEVAQKKQIDFNDFASTLTHQKNLTRDWVFVVCRESNKTMLFMDHENILLNAFFNLCVINGNSDYRYLELPDRPGWIVDIQN